MSKNPLAVTITLATLAVSTVLPLALSAGEAAPVPPTPAPATALPYTWSPPAQALLHFLDPDAGIRVGLDLAGIRSQLLKTKPFSLLAEPAMAPWIAQGHQRLVATSQSDPLKLLAFDTFADGPGVVASVNFRLELESPAEHILIAMGTGKNSAGDWQQCLARKGNRGPQTERTFVGFTQEDGDHSIFTGFDENQHLLVLASPSWLEARCEAKSPPAPPAPFWFRLDAGKLIARYAELSGPADASSYVAAMLGHGWRTMRPVIESRMWIDGHGPEPVLRSDIVVSGCAPFSPIHPLAMAKAQISQVLAAFAPVPLRRPAISIPPSPDRLAAFSMGLQVPPRMDHSSNDPLTVLLEDFWSGDVAIELRPGMPLPKAALAFGLRPGVDSSAVLNTIAGMLKANVQVGSSPLQATALVMGGTLTLVAESDRIIGAFNADVVDWPGLDTAATPTPGPVPGEPSAECSAMIDFPAVVRTWGPLAALALSPEQVKRIPPLPLLIAHLPVWRAAWKATSDGCRVTEEGLPLFNYLIYTVYCLAVMAANPAEETVRAQPPHAPAGAGTADF